MIMETVECCCCDGGDNCVLTICAVGSLEKSVVVEDMDDTGTALCQDHGAVLIWVRTQ